MAGIVILRTQVRPMARVLVAGAVRVRGAGAREAVRRTARGTKVSARAAEGATARARSPMTAIARVIARARVTARATGRRSARRHARKLHLQRSAPHVQARATQAAFRSIPRLLAPGKRKRAGNSSHNTSKPKTRRLPQPTPVRVARRREPRPGGAGRPVRQCTCRIESRFRRGQFEFTTYSIPTVIGRGSSIAIHTAVCFGGGCWIGRWRTVPGGRIITTTIWTPPVTTR